MGDFEEALYHAPVECLAKSARTREERDHIVCIVYKIVKQFRFIYSMTHSFSEDQNHLFLH